MRRFVLSLALCYFVLVFFSPFSIAIISLGEERASTDASICACFGFVCFLLLSGIDCGLLLWHFLDFSLIFFYLGFTVFSRVFYIEQIVHQRWSKTGAYLISDVINIDRKEQGF